MDDKIAARFVAAVARRQEEVLAALALVGPGGAEVRQELEESVVGVAHHAGRDLDHSRAIQLEIERGDRVHGAVIPGEVVFTGLHEVGKHADIRGDCEFEVTDLRLHDAVDR